MDQELQNAEKRVVGTKQVLRALNGGFAARVFLAKDADGFIYHRVNALCEETKTPVTMVDTCRSWESSAPSASKPPRQPCSSKRGVPRNYKASLGWTLL